MWRPYVYTIVMVILALTGYLNGYATARVLRAFGTTDWNFSAFMSALVLPLVIVISFGIEMLVNWIERTGERYSFGKTLGRTAAWYLANGLMCYIGAYRGYLAKSDKPVVNVSPVRRTIPPQPVWMSIFVIAPVFGAIQFASMYAEFGYLIDSVFKSSMYSMFGFLLVDCVLLLLVVALLCVVQTYMQLCYQNYEWQWRSFIVGASGTLYMFAYSCIYLFTQMKLARLMSDLVFLVYVEVFLLCYAVAAGAVGVGASYMFVNYIYKDIRND